MYDYLAMSVLQSVYNKNQSYASYMQSCQINFFFFNTDNRYLPIYEQHMAILGRVPG